MAGSGSPESGDGWWSSMITAAKEKSVNALSATKRDLAEFVSVLRNDTTTAVKDAGMNIKGLIQQEDSGESEDTKPSRPHFPTSSPGLPYDRSQAQLFTLQSSPNTYLSDPTGVEKEYQEWAGQFDVQPRQAEISQLLVSCPHVRTMHGQLVPAKVSYENFWKRYFFKSGLLQQEEQRRADLMARAEPRQEDLQWEELEEADGEGEGEGEKDEGLDGGEGGKDRESKDRTAEVDLAEVASSIVEVKSDHLRSESSDSFVCISEDLPQSERSHTSPNGDGNGVGDWEYLKVADTGEEVDEVEEKVVEDLVEGETGRREDGGKEGGEETELERTTEGAEGGRSGGREAVKVKRRKREGGVRKETGDQRGEAASESSDWESWDD